MKRIITLLALFVLNHRLQAQVSFILSSSPTAGFGPRSVVAADVNGDGKLDLICANYYGNTLSVLTNATPFPSWNFLTNGLVAYYPFNDNVNDASGNGNVGSLVGTNFQYSQGLYLNTTPLPNDSVGNA